MLHERDVVLDKALLKNAELGEEIESLRERWACVECGRTPDGGKSGDLYISICHGCHRCMEHSEPTCTVCAYDTEGMRLRNRDLLVENAALRAQVEELKRELAEWESEEHPVQAYEKLAYDRLMQASAAEARLAKVVGALKGEPRPWAAIDAALAAARGEPTGIRRAALEQIEILKELRASEETIDRVRQVAARGEDAEKGGGE